MIGPITQDEENTKNVNVEVSLEEFRNISHIIGNLMF